MFCKLLEKSATPTIHMTEPTKQQKLDGFDLTIQDMSPCKRAMVEPSAKEKWSSSAVIQQKFVINLLLSAAVCLLGD